MTPRPVLTALYVPGDRPDRIAKALQAGADAVIVDLEDAVAAARKDEARAALAGALEGLDPLAVVQVRVNARGSAWHEADLAAIAALAPSVEVRVPKIASAEDVEAVRAELPERRIHALLETALSIERAFDIATAGVAGISIGEADLRAELGVPAGADGEDGLRWARSRIVNAAAAAHLPPPVMSVFADVADLDGLAASCREGRRLGFLGRTAIHPRQLSVIREAFSPTAREIERAQQIVDRVRDAAADGAGTVVLDDGTFLDVAMVRAAERTLAIVA